jgi:hypothetical protein
VSVKWGTVGYRGDRGDRRKELDKFVMELRAMDGTKRCLLK